jgi:hypothetical protein
MMLRLCPLLIVLPLGTAACVETGTYDATVSQLAEAKRTSARKDEELRAYQWQVATLAQRLREAQAQTEARERELYAQVQQLAASNAALGERLKKVESERAALVLAAAAEPPASRDGKPSREPVHPEELRRMIALADARNALIVEALARLERVVAAPRPTPVDLRPQASGSDVIDPFNTRK